MAGGKESKEGSQTIFFTPLDPHHSDASEAETSTDLSKPSKLVYYDNQTAVVILLIVIIAELGNVLCGQSTHRKLEFHSVAPSNIRKSTCIWETDAC